MMRERLTITLKSDILQKVDAVIDGSKIRNRSHAIEYLIQKASAPSIDRVLILAGGKGIKSTPLAKEVPKAMLVINGKPVLQHTIELCKKYSISNIFVSIGPEGNSIEEYFSDGSKFGVHITYLRQTEENVGTAPSLRQAKEVMSDQSFLLLYGDVLADINIPDFINFHMESGSTATMALTSIASAADWGVVSMHGAHITSFTEKPDPKNMHSYVINAGMYVFDSSVFDYISSTSKRLEQDLFPKLAKEQKLSGYLFDGRWYDVGSLKIYHLATKEWQPTKTTTK